MFYNLYFLRAPRTRNKSDIHPSMNSYVYLWFGLCLAEVVQELEGKWFGDRGWRCCPLALFGQ